MGVEENKYNSATCEAITECINAYILTRTNEVKHFINSYFLVAEYMENITKIIKIQHAGLKYMYDNYHVLLPVRLDTNRLLYSLEREQVYDFVSKLAREIDRRSNGHTLVISLLEYSIVKRFSECYGGNSNDFVFI